MSHAASRGQDSSGTAPRPAPIRSFALRSGSERLGSGRAGVDYEETVAAVCKYLCEGKTPSEIVDLVKARYGIEMTREAPYKFIRHAALKKWLRFVAPGEDTLTQRIRAEFGWLQHAEVVHTSVLDDVAYRTAALVIELLRSYARGPHPKEEVHIGFAGGHSMSMVAARLGELLSQPTDGLPKDIVFHSLVAGFDLATPVLSPNAFFTYFASVALVVHARFVALHAPAIVRPDQMDAFLALPGIRDSRESAKDLDIILTSAGVMADEHSMLYRYYWTASRETITRLRRDGCVGDMLWLPLARSGPIDLAKYEYRAMSLLELGMLPAYIRRGTQVLLTLGPCGICDEPKTKILETILDLDEHLITHLVVDSRSARGLFEA